MKAVECILCGEKTKTTDRLIARIPIDWLLWANVWERVFRCEHCEEVSIEACPF